MNKKRSNKKQIWIIAIIAIVFLELLFDVFEIVMGKYMVAINPARPQVGRLWEEEQKDILGEEEAAMVETLPPDSVYTHLIADYFELLRLLQAQGKATLTKQNFLDFYKHIEPKLAKQLVDPLDLYDLDRNGNWRSVFIRKTSGQLSLSFLDGFNQPIKETYASTDITSGPLKNTSQLENDPAYVGRLVSSEIFFTAFDQLSRLYRLQIMNDPYRLIQWKDTLFRVGISKFSQNGSVELAFELDDGSVSNIYKVTAAELAVGYLVSAINQQGGVTISLPQRMEVGNE